MAQYSFPILENDELLPCLEEMDIPLNAAQLAKPTYETVRPLFENVVTNLTGVTREELNQPVFAAIDAFEFPELHDESIAVRNFFRQLSRLMTACGVKDFTLKDIYKPEMPRLRRHLSAIINFAKFREEKLIAYSEMQASLEALAEERRVLEEAQAHMASELKQLQQARALEEEDAARVEAEAAELHAANAALNKQHGALAAEVRALKVSLNAAADAGQAVKFELVAAKQENERLQSNIVQSPEKFQRALAELQSAVEGERALVADTDRRSRELQARVDTIAKVDKEVHKCLELMREMEGDIARKRDASKRVKGLRDGISAARLESADLEAQQQHLKRTAANLKDRIRKLESQAALKKEALESSLEEQLREKEVVEADNAMNAAKILQNESQIRATTEKVRELQNAHDARVRAVLERYGQLRKAVADYNSRLDEAMAAAEPASGDVAALAARMGDTLSMRDQA